MSDLTLGFSSGKIAVVDAILKKAALDLTLAPTALADAMFTNNFMPYAVANWQYEGADCNCGDLSQALTAAWVYVKSKRPTTLPDAGVCKSINAMGDDGYGLITLPWKVFAGPAYGNVRVGATKALDGRCLFPTHWICQIGAKFYDPTYSHIGATAQEVVQRQLRKFNPCIWISIDNRYLYVRNKLLAAKQFTDSWQEMDARVWVKFDDWKRSTTRDRGHSRSQNLQKVDAALYAFENQNDRTFDPIQELTVAFERWGEKDPKEANNVNVNSCVRKLKSFLGARYPTSLDNL